VLLGVKKRKFFREAVRNSPGVNAKGFYGFLDIALFYVL